MRVNSAELVAPMVPGRQQIDVGQVVQVVIVGEVVRDIDATETTSRTNKPDALESIPAVQCVGVFLVGMNAYWIKLRTEANDLRDRMATAFRSAFPESEMVDPIVQAQRELVRLRAELSAAD